MPELIDIQRHYTQLSEKDTDAVVEIVADLIVAYLKKRAGGEPCKRPTGIEERAEFKEVHA